MHAERTEGLVTHLVKLVSCAVHNQSAKSNINQPNWLAATNLCITNFSATNLESN